MIGLGDVSTGSSHLGDNATMMETDQSTPRRKAPRGYEEFQKPIITRLMVKTVLGDGCLARAGMSSGD